MEDLHHCREKILTCAGHALVIGGPGSGKTTIALQKAISRIKQGMAPGQSVLFLSFSRSAVARILSAATMQTNQKELECLSIQTFHSFFWDVVRCHAYLLGTPSKISLLLPQDEMSLSGGVKYKKEGWDLWEAERESLFHTDGRAAFDLFAPKAWELLSGSVHILHSIAQRYPIIIVDEAQDTGDFAWNCVELLSKHTQVLCLADMEQQIYDYLPGVRPDRVSGIRKSLNPFEIDLGGENHRSQNTDILLFGNDILNNSPRGASYTGVSSLKYPKPNLNILPSHDLLKEALNQLKKHIPLTNASAPFSIAILVGTNRSAMDISKRLRSCGSEGIEHKLYFDNAKSLLSARLVAFLLEPSYDKIDLQVATCMELIAASIKATGNYQKKCETLLIQARNLRSGSSCKAKIKKELEDVISTLKSCVFSGRPEKDWATIIDILRKSTHLQVREVVSCVDLLGPILPGHSISRGLASRWFKYGSYTQAREALDVALGEDMMTDGTEPSSGLHVMNFHKSKGRQFDGVIIIGEAKVRDKGVTSSFVCRDDEDGYKRSRRVLRVAITRARYHVFLLTPADLFCPILNGHNL